jgi:hypothetical protein
MRRPMAPTVAKRGSPSVATRSGKIAAGVSDSNAINRSRPSGVSVPPSANAASGRSPRASR